MSDDNSEKISREPVMKRRIILVILGVGIMIGGLSLPLIPGTVGCNNPSGWCQSDAVITGLVAAIATAGFCVVTIGLKRRS